MFQKAEVKYENERIVILKFCHIDFGEQEIEINLFPKGVNFILRSDNKQVSYKKVKKITFSEQKDLKFIVRSLDKLVEQIQDSKKVVAQPKINYKELYSKELKKMTKVKNKLSQDIISKYEKILIYKKLADDISAHGRLDFDTPFTDYIDDQLSPHQNSNSLYEKYKKEKLKIIGSKNRLQELDDKISSLNSVTDFKKWYNQRKKINSRNEVKTKDKKTRFKTFPLKDEYKLLCGLSAKNNDELIKASKPWFLWMHLRDYPSTHGVIPTNKGEKLNLAILQQAGKALVKFNFKDKKEKYMGLKFNMIYCEVRHLKKVKGVAGKVTYSKDNNLLVSMDK